METKHTPGPWKVRFMRPDDPTSDFFVEAKNNNKTELGYGIEIMGDDYGDHNGYPTEQRLADAKLIAAAPELLEALLGITSNPHIFLSDLIYDVREREGQGWEGPHVKQWGEAVEKVKDVLKKLGYE